MRKVVLAAALFAAASFQGASAADKQCYSAADVEAEQAILLQTNIMVISSACKDTVYGEFRARNKDAIIRYQKAMIDHFRRAGSRNAQSEFDRWNTSLANEIALKQGALPIAQVSKFWPRRSLDDARGDAYVAEVLTGVNQFGALLSVVVVDVVLAGDNAI